MFSFPILTKFTISERHDVQISYPKSDGSLKIGYQFDCPLKLRPFLRKSHCLCQYCVTIFFTEFYPKENEKYGAKIHLRRYINRGCLCTVFHESCHYLTALR